MHQGQAQREQEVIETVGLPRHWTSTKVSQYAFLNPASLVQFSQEPFSITA